MSHLFTLLTLILLLPYSQLSELNRSNSIGSPRQRIYILRHKIGFIQRRLHYIVHDLNRVKTNLAHVKMMMEVCEANNSLKRWEYFAALERSLFKELCLLKSERLDKEHSLEILRVEMQFYINELYFSTHRTSEG